MSSRKVYELTLEGLNNLKEEFKILKEEKRPNAIQLLQEAKALGDLSENADYDAARTEQAEVESRITELEYMLSNAKIIEKKKANGVVVLGSIVLIEYIDNKETEEYQIVGSMEADPFENKISNESPIGKAIINKKVGDILSVESPTCSYKIKIIKID